MIEWIILIQVVVGILLIYIYNSENYHNIVLYQCLIIFTQCYSFESANNCFKVKIKEYVFNVLREYDMQEDKSWSGNVIVDFFNFIHSPEECQNLCKVGLFCYIYHFHFSSESDSGITNVCNFTCPSVRLFLINS